MPISGMKKINCFRWGFVVVALGFIILSGCETTGSSSSTASAAANASADSGTLVIKRAANMGSGLFLNVSIDGKHVTALSKGRSYNGPLPVGSHVVSVLLVPNRLNLDPTETRITVEKGQTYTLTAVWEGEKVVLR
jgi:hypothetical protein